LHIAEYRSVVVAEGGLPILHQLLSSSFGILQFEAARAVLKLVEAGTYIYISLLLW
jgi:hypothetical protein